MNPKSRKILWLVCGPLRNEPEFTPGLPQYVHDHMKAEGYRMFTDPREQQLGGIALLPNWEKSRGARMMAARAIEEKLPLLMVRLLQNGDGTVAGVQLSDSADRAVISKILEAADAN